MLPFTRPNTTIRYLDGRGDTIPAMDVSTWRRNPIPACNCDGGDGCHAPGTNNAGGRESYTNGTIPIPTGFLCKFGTMFDVPFGYGYGQHVWNNKPGSTPQALVWVMVDTVQAPAAKGEYVLRWR